MEITDRCTKAVTVQLNSAELVTLCNSMNEALEAVEDWEFETRLGVSKSAVQQLLNAFKELIPESQRMTETEEA